MFVLWGRCQWSCSAEALSSAPHSGVIKLFWDLGPRSFLQPPLRVGEGQGWLGFCHQGRPVPSVSAWWLARAWEEHRESAPCPRPAPSTPHSLDPHGPCPRPAPSTPHSRDPHGPWARPAPSTPHSRDPHGPCPRPAPSTPHSRDPHGPPATPLSPEVWATASSSRTS